MTRFKRLLFRQTLRQLGAAAGLQVVLGPDDRPDFDRYLDIPIILLAKHFRSDAALRGFVLRKLEQAHDRDQVRRIAVIFEAA